MIGVTDDDEREAALRELADQKLRLRALGAEVGIRKVAADRRRMSMPGHPGRRMTDA